MKIFNTLMTAIALSATLLCVCAYGASNAEYDTTLSMSSGLENQNGEFVDADTTISGTDGSASGGDYISQEGFFAWVDTYVKESPKLLSVHGTEYFVCVYSEQKVTFSVQYCDPYNVPVDTGYPKVSYWCRQGSTTTLSLDLAPGTTCVYQKQADLACGTYNYFYRVKNSQMLSETALAVSSFVVTARPVNVKNTGLADNTYTSNGKVVLTWSAVNPEASPLSYKLYFGTDPNNLPVFYEGNTPSAELDSLSYDQTYYWKAEAINPAGISTFSPVYSFRTIKRSSSAFNYPNPFNPAAGQKTSIVFNMSDAGSADMSIYTEMGHLCWSGSFGGLKTGENEVSYDGRDSSGRMMYNGTYPCVIIKKYPGRTEKDFCRILIIK